jgi:hypothetical protein
VRATLRRAGTYWGLIDRRVRERSGVVQYRAAHVTIRSFRGRLAPSLIGTVFALGDQPL